MRQGLAVLFLSLISVSAGAQIYNSSVVAATGGTGRASVDIGEASFINPATLVHLRGTHILLSQTKSDVAASISENTPDIIFPASLAYVQKKLDGAKNPVLHDMRLTLAEKMGTKWGFGFTAHYYQVREDEDAFQQTNGDVGIVYTPTPSWGLALVSYDVAGSREDLPLAYRLTSKTGGGLNYLYGDKMRFRLDALSAPNNNFSKMTTMVGYEIYLNKWVLARLGHQEDRFNEARYGSLGIGLDLPRFDLNYAFVSELPRNESERHSIDLAISF